MWTAGSADCFRFRGAFEGCISGHDSNFSHRPYHKNCRCALHDKSRPNTGDLSPPPIPTRCNSVSFSVSGRSWRHVSLALAVSTADVSRDSVVGYPALGENSLLVKLVLGEFGDEETIN